MDFVKFVEIVESVEVVDAKKNNTRYIATEVFLVVVLNLFDAFAIQN